MIPLPLSIVTITKDDPAGLARTVASTARLRAAGAEQWVVDGSAADTLAPEVSSAAGCTVVRAEPRGIAAALNVGVAAAAREWVWFLNGGDEVDPQLAVESLHRLLATTQADLVIAGTTYAGETQPRPPPPVDRRWPPVRSWIPHPSTLVRRRLFAQVGPFDERFTIAMDYEWWLRAAAAGIEPQVADVPLAVFAPGGLSQRPENLATIRREQHAALCRHRVALGLSWWWLAARWCKAWWLARGAASRAPGGEHRHG